VFKNIVHTAAIPAFIVCGQLQVQGVVLNNAAGRLRMNVYPDVLVAIRIGMTDHNVNFVPGGSIGWLYGKRYFGFITTAPGLPGNSGILFIHIYRTTGGENEVRNNQYEVRNIMRDTLVQGNCFCKDKQATGNMQLTIDNGHQLFKFAYCPLPVACWFTVRLKPVPWLFPVHPS
jgi:hypothetical protein